MAFFSNPSTLGNAFEIIGILQVIGGIFGIIDGIRDDKIDTAFAIVIGIGAVICGGILIFYGNRVRNGTISEKIDILATYVRTAGVITIISGLFSVAAEIIIESDILTEAIAAIGFIVIGLIIILISTKINDGKQTTGDKIIWVLLLIFFIIGIAGSIMTVVDGIKPILFSQIVIGICYTIAYIFLTFMLFDSDVRREMGM